jgi:hypothetical protein
MSKKKPEKDPWDSKIGRDCVSLDLILCRWLGKRLVFLSQNTGGVPHRFMRKIEKKDAQRAHEKWQVALASAGTDLMRYGAILDDWPSPRETQMALAAQEALRWVAEYLPDLWD